MKKNPQFDAEGYQIGMKELNGEKLPALASAGVLARKSAGLPSVAQVKKALGALAADSPRTYVLAREKSGLTQEQFAVAIGVKVATWRQWEQGRRKPTGPAVALLHLLSSRPGLIADLRPPPLPTGRG